MGYSESDLRRFCIKSLRVAYSKRLLPCAISVLLMLAGTCCRARADEGADWKAFNTFEAQMADTRAAQPEKAVEAYRAWFVARPLLHPMVLATVLSRVIEMDLDGVRDAGRALEVAQWSEQRWQNAPPAQPVQVVTLEGHARALLALDRAPEAEKLVQDRWAGVKAAAYSRHPYLVMYASRTLQQLSAALEKQGKRAARAALLQQVLVEMPVFLDDRAQGSDGWKNGWMWDAVNEDLIAAKQPDQALAWARLQFVCCAFDKDAIARATRNLGRAWVAGENLPTVQAFAAAQDDASKLNPLAKIPLPALDASALRAQSKRLRPGDATPAEAAPEVIGLLLATGQAREAMAEAQALVKAAPENPESAQQVCRVFKGADGSVRRANAFIAYLQGKGPDPSLEAERAPAPAPSPSAPLPAAVSPIAASPSAAK